MWNFSRILTLVSAGVLTACGDSSTELDGRKAGENGAPRVVVAVLDSAMNPYHDFFHAGSPIYPAAAPSAVTPEVLAEIGVPPENIIELTRTGNIVKDKKTDEAKWKKVRRGKPYWFKGTNVIGVSYASSNENRLVPMPEKNPHGVGCTASVLAANPEAVVLFIETWDAYANDDAHVYAMQHPAVDILSSSYGFQAPTGTPLPLPYSSTATYDGVLKMGKLHIQAAGNGPGFTPGNGGSGVWWSIGVSGFNEYSSNGQELLSSNYPDFVSDYSQDIPYCQDCERGLSTGVSGTSFSTPRSAGVFSRVLLEARRALGHGGAIRIKPDGSTAMAEGGGKTISNWRLRRALEEAAYVDYGVLDFDPTAVDTAIPINDAAPWLQLGWGDLTADPAKQVVPEALAQLGFGTPARSKGADYCEYQAANMRIRQNYWDAVAASAGTETEVVPDPNPYLFCDSAVPTL